MQKSIGFVIPALIVAFIAGFLLTATGTAAAPLQRRRSIPITIEVFLDTAGHNYNQPCPGCDGHWDNADWCGELSTPLPPVTLVLRNAETNEEITHVTTRKISGTGRSWAYLSVPEGDSFILEVEDVPEGFVSCPTSSLSRLITPYEYRHGHLLERFYFWWGCPAGPPPGEPPPPPPPPPGVDSYYYGCGAYPFTP